MTLPYPRNAEAIAEARANGMRPAGTVIVALCAAPNWPNAMVHAKPDVAYRWDWIRDLPVVVIVNAGTRMNDVLREIYRQDVQQLDVIDIERQRGWLVDFYGARMATVRWPLAWVKDWLGDGEWHRELARIKGLAWN